MAITAKQLACLKKLISIGEERTFYSWRPWKKLRKQVMALDHYECQDCKAKGRYTPATLVHHVAHLKDRPDLAMSIYNPDTKERQLVSLCRQCHELRHPEALKQYGWAVIKIPVTQERWD